ncbi:MAG: hypothetical protein WD851_19300 [Pirellulales bacterium]
MVLIQPPAGWTDAPGETSATATAPAKPPTATAPQPLVAQSFHAIADLGGIDLTTPAGPSPQAPAEVQAQVPSVERWSPWIVWGSVAGSLAIVTASLAWSLWPDGGERVANAAVGDAAALDPASATRNPKSEIRNPKSEKPANDAPVAMVAKKPEIEPEAPAAVAEFALPEPPPAVEPSLPPPAVPEPDAPTESNVASAAPHPVIDPRDLDPEDLDLILRKNPAASKPTTDVATAPSDKPSAATDIEIADDSENATRATRASLEQALAAAVKQGEPEMVRRGPTSAEDLQPIELDQRLATNFAEIDAPKLPLHRAVAMLTELTAIPITLDPAALRMAGISVDQPVAIRGTNATAANLIRTTLAAAKLQYQQRGDQLIIVRSGADAVGTREYRVEDLFAPGAANASEFGALIQTLVVPQSWTGQGGDGRLAVNNKQLTVTQSQAVHYDALVFCERLRKARRLPLQSKYPAQLLRTEPLETALAHQLDRHTTFSFVTWTTLPLVFRHWEQATELTILVDWSALADVQLGPASTISCAVEDMSWREALEGVLEPLGLAWVPVDENTIQITSRGAAESHQYIEFYPLAKVGDTESLLAGLREHQAADSAVVFDAASRSLLVRANASGHRQVARQLELKDDR